MRAPLVRLLVTNQLKETTNMRKTTMIRALALAVVLGAASTAMAAPKLWVKLIEGTSSSGPADHRWSDCSGGTGRALSVLGRAYTAAGVASCTAEQYLTGRWKVTTGSCTGAVKHKASLAANFLTYCETAQTSSWTQQIGCSKTLATQVTGTVGPCANRLLRAYSEGVN
jgi:hypothetical protein